VCAAQGGAEHDELGLGGAGQLLGGDDAVQPAGVDGVVHEGLRAQQLLKVLHRRADLAANQQLLDIINTFKTKASQNRSTSSS
jgi:hypothetical protein